MTEWALWADIISRILPLIVILLLGVGVVTWKIGGPYCQYIYYLSQSGSEKGNEDLAKYLAKTTGGKSINVDDSWPSFLPAAMDLHSSFIKTKNTNSN